MVSLVRLRSAADVVPLRPVESAGRRTRCPNSKRSGIVDEEVVVCRCAVRKSVSDGSNNVNGFEIVTQVWNHEAWADCKL